VLSAKKNKDGRISGRIDGDLRARLDAISQRFGVADTVMLEDALTALADLVETRGKYERPMEMCFVSEAHAYAAEDPPTTTDPPHLHASKAHPEPRSRRPA
jgi:hypothetical protein